LDVAEASTIGARCRWIRRRRGLSLDVVAGLAGITKSYLSMLELGQRGFNRRGLIEDLAEALGCSVVDLTGQPYLAPDRSTVEGRAALPGISLALNDYGPDEVPDLTPRPLDELLAWAERADEQRDQGNYSLPGRNLGTLLSELQAHALTAGPADRPTAFRALVRACAVAGAVASKIAGNADLSIAARRRAYDMACRYGDPALIGFARWKWSLQLVWMTARGRACRVLTTGINELGRSVQLGGGDTLSAEMLGFLHLSSAQCAARDQRADDARAHLNEAAAIAERIGEHNGLRLHFGPTNVAVWRLGIGIELGESARAYEEATRTPLDVAALGSQERTAALHFDLARALAQDGAHDREAIRHLDTADRLTPNRTRNDPLARELLDILHRRARRQVWELDSLRHRFGISGRGPRRVDG
jgi:transcriptional regulator with XRE-family HTH domain